MRDILVWGYTNLNLGDDLFFDILFSSYPNYTFYIPITNNTEEFFRRYKNVKYIVLHATPLEKVYCKFSNKYIFNIEYRKFLNKIRSFKFDAIVNIGGSIFEEWIRIDNHIKKYELDLQYFPNTPKFFIGCSFGPHVSDDFYSRYKLIFHYFYDVCFRDKESFYLFKDLKNVRYSQDIVYYYLKNNSLFNERYNVGSYSPNKRKVGFVLKYLEGETYYKKFSQVTKNYINRGFDISFYSFCSATYDSKVFEKLKGHFSKSELSKIRFIEYNGDLCEMLNDFRQNYFMYCGRFHAMILSCLYKQCFLPIVYHKKQVDYLNDNYSNPIYIDINNVSDTHEDEFFKFILPEQFVEKKLSTKQEPFYGLNLVMNKARKI